MAKRLPKPASTQSPAKQLAGFIAKFDPVIAARIRSLRAALRKLLPGAVEMVYDNYNFFVIGYGPTERASEAILSIAAAAKGVSLCFLYGATLPDPQKLLMGSGSQTRFVRFASAATLKEPAVKALIRAAVAQAKSPLPKSGGYLVIKSISKNQRPRK
jgi:hypothetical protein